MTVDAGALHLHGQHRDVGVGDQHQALAQGPHLPQELLRVGQHLDQVLHLPLQGHDVHVQLPGPVLQGIPGERALHSPETRHERLQGGLGRQAVALAEAQRQVLQPEMVVEMQVQERAVHVQENRMDAGEFRLFLRARGHAGYHILRPASLKRRTLPVTQPDEKLLAPLLDIARSAGEQIMRIYATDFDVAVKQDQSPVTEADLAAHRVIVADLQRITPDLPVLSEESADIPYAERRRWDGYWLVDPLDGTKEFISKNGDFTVNIALVQGGDPIVGVVHVPATGLSY